jgi:hypothetical protein
MHTRLCLLAAFLLNVSLVLGQPKGIPEFHASVVVTDSNGARISGAKIVIERYDERITAETDMNGLAHLRIPMGHYAVKVSANGFKAAEFSDFVVNDDGALLNAILEVGNVATGWSDNELVQTIPSDLPWNLLDEQPTSTEKEHFLDGQFKVVSETMAFPPMSSKHLTRLRTNHRLRWLTPSKDFKPPMW